MYIKPSPYCKNVPIKRVDIHIISGFIALWTFLCLALWGEKLGDIHRVPSTLRLYPNLSLNLLNTFNIKGDGKFAFQNEEHIFSYVPHWKFQRPNKYNMSPTVTFNYILTKPTFVHPDLSPLSNASISLAFFILIMNF